MPAKRGESAERPTVFLVDGTYTVFRSYFAIRGLSAPDGTPTGGVFGFVNTVRKLIRDRDPDHLAVAFDREEPTHRDEMFKEYKANRPDIPEDLIPQFDLAAEACRAMAWPDLSAAGYEADDVIATLAAKAREEGLDVVIVTSDKDLYQLVGEGVVVLSPAKEDRILDEAGVEDVFGVRPELVVDVLALMGDAVDNVPGVPGVGEKTAKSIVRRYGSLDGVRQRARAFRLLRERRDAALAALDAGDEQRLSAALDSLQDPAAELASLEREIGDEAGQELADRFAAAEGLDVPSARSEERALRKALKDLDKKTQPKVWMSIAEHAEQLDLSERLVVVRRDAPVSLDLEAMRTGPPRAEEAADLFRRLGFRRLSEEMEQAVAGALRSGNEEFDVDVLDEPEPLGEGLDALSRVPLLAVDTETDSLDVRRARLVGVSLAGEEGRGAYIPVGHRDARQVGWDESGPLLRELLEDPKLRKAGQNLKFDRAVLRRAGIELNGVAFDTLIAAQLLDPGRTVSHRLDDLAERYLGHRMIPYSAVARRDEQEVTLDLVDVGDVARYAVEDAVVALRLVDPLRRELEAHDLLELFETIEMPLVQVLEEMESLGLCLDVEMLEGFSAEMATQLDELEQQIYELAGGSFNVNSPQQLRKVLFEDLELKPTGRRTQKTRKHSTGQESLEALALVHPLPGKVLEYRELAKLKSTYVDALPRLVDPSDGRVHGQLHQLGAATGRLSSSDPNLQNIPVRSEQGRRIRAAFVPREGWTFVSADYSQMELRILAHVSDDPALIEAFEKGVDIHRWTAALVAGIEVEAVDDDERARAKAVNFGIIYGMSEYRLAREQGMSVEEARLFIQSYFQRFPRVRDYIDGVIAEVERTGEVRTLFGRLRRFPELRGDAAGGARLSKPAREQLQRQAVNTTIQGTGADVVKRAMVAVSRALAREGLEARLLLQVHDELLLESPPGELETVVGLVRGEMEGAARLSVPLSVDVRTAGDWARAH